MLTSNPYDRATASGAAARSAFRCPASSVRIVDDDGAALPAGRRSARIEVRGPNVFAGYWRMPEKTARRVQRRRLVSHRRRRHGRRPRLRLHRRPQQGPDHQRRLQRLSGRDRGRLNELPGVAESAVVGVPHADFGEAVVAVVVRARGRALDADALIAARSKAKIANFKVPKARVRRRRAAAQRDGQGAEEPAARAARRRSSPEHAALGAIAARHEKGPALARPAR